MDKSRLKESHKTQLQRFTFTDGKSLDYDYVALARRCNRPKFDSLYLNPGHQAKYQSGSTPILNIKWASLKDVCDIPIKAEETRLSLDEFILSLKDAMKNTIRDMWNPKDKHIVSHSAGYDSRIISLALAELRDEGMEIGEVHFRCHQPECEGFFRIMEIEGWDKDQYSCFHSSDEDYYNMGVHDIQLNGFVSYFQQMNWWSDIIPRKEEKDWVIVNGWGGGFFKYLDYNGNLRVSANTTDRDLMITGEMRNQVAWDRYMSWESQWIVRFKDMLQPFRGYEYLKVALTVDVDWCKALTHLTDNMRVRLAKVFTYNVDEVKRGDHDYILNISEKRKADMMRLYRDSLFYIKYRTEINPFRNIYGWDARLWGFAVTVYQKIYE